MLATHCPEKRLSQVMRKTCYWGGCTARLTVVITLCHKDNLVIMIFSNSFYCPDPLCSLTMRCRATTFFFD